MSLSALKSEELFKGKVMLDERSVRCCEQAWGLRLTRSSADAAHCAGYSYSAFLNSGSVDVGLDQNAQTHTSSQAHTNTLVAVRLRQAPF